MVYPALLPLMRTPRLPAVDWTDVPADLNRLVRLAERRSFFFLRVCHHISNALYIHPPIVYIKLHGVIRTKVSSTPKWTYVSIFTSLSSTSKPVPVAARMLRLPVRIPPGALMSVSCECCVLSGRGLCDGPIPRPEESYRVWVCQWVWSGATITLYTYQE